MAFFSSACASQGSLGILACVFFVAKVTQGAHIADQWNFRALARQSDPSPVDVISVNASTGAETRTFIFNEWLTLEPGSKRTVQIDFAPGASAQRALVVEVAYDDSLPLDKRPDPLVSVRDDIEPLVVAGDLEQPDIDIVLKQAKVSVFADAWDDVAYYTKRNFQHAVLPLNVSSSDANQSVFVQLQNIAIPRRNTFLGRLTMLVVPYERSPESSDVGQSCPSYSNVSFPLDVNPPELANAETPMCNPYLFGESEPFCSALTGQCECPDRDPPESGASFKGFACERRVYPLRHPNGPLYIERQLLPGIPTVAEFTVSRPGKVAVLFDYYKTNNAFVYMVVKAPFTDGGPSFHSFSTGNGTELPTLWDAAFIAPDDSKRIILDDVPAGQKLYVAFYNVRRDTSAKADSGQIGFATFECGEEGEEDCPDTLQQPLPKFMLIVGISAAVVIFIMVILLVFMVFRRQAATESMVEARRAAAESEAARKTTAKVSEDRIDALFPSDTYAGRSTTAQGSGLDARQSDNEEGEEGPDVRVVQCSVCLCGFEEGDQIRTLPCMHFYHRACIDGWISARVTCPECRAIVRSPSGSRLYKPGEYHERSEADAAESSNSPGSSSRTGSRAEADRAGPHVADEPAQQRTTPLFSGLFQSAPTLTSSTPLRTNLPPAMRGDIMP
ncbi:E3 ubiquitin-protein ligase ATL9 [Porphyridium purpureum]|uniref:E3 ubiquitin-protein ligase ATL9 n=1 Tax=Porphyridium purpureum TaxID=35688 RepID=A0A5J4YTU7_PORPP|nr:E3 ubiquitin-protein ligase ATL9 [Porphyridium purpureum]|eukprot:POR8934..scf229_5